jgi:hypothetical protein
MLKNVKCTGGFRLGCFDEAADWYLCEIAYLIVNITNQFIHPSLNPHRGNKNRPFSFCSKITSL